jgi:hypothetical protein
MPDVDLNSEQSTATQGANMTNPEAPPAPEPPAPETPAPAPETPTPEPDAASITDDDLALLEAAVDTEPAMVEFKSRMPELRVLFGLADADVYQFHGGKLRVSEADAARLMSHKFYHEEHFFLAKDVVTVTSGVEPIQRLPATALKWCEEGLTVYAMPSVQNNKLTLVLKSGAMVDMQFEDGYVAVRTPDVCEAMAAHIFTIQGRMFRVNRGTYDPVEDAA